MIITNISEKNLVTQNKCYTKHLVLKNIINNIQYTVYIICRNSIKIL